MALGLIDLLCCGGLAGWLVCVVWRIEARQRVIGNIVAGVLGALFGGAVVAPAIYGAASIERGIDPMNVVLAFLGAGLVLSTYNYANPSTDEDPG